MKFLRFAAAVGLFALVSADASAAGPPHDPLNFTVLRNGDVVGSHTLRFQPMGGGLNVTVDTNVVVKIAFIPVYRFEHHAEEVWQRDRLLSLNSTTNDDGTPHTLKAHAGASLLEVSGDGGNSWMAETSIPASLWNRATVTQTTLLNSLDGRPMAVHVADLGDDMVSVHGQKRPARHYSMTGELSRELWYDATGSLVRVRFKAKDDSDIQYALD